MIEVRGTIKNIEKTRRKIEELGGKLLANYEFKDIIFSEDKNKNLSKDFLRLRIYFKSNWQTKDFVLVRKKTKFKKSGKISKNIFKKEFKSEKNSIKYIKENFLNFKKNIEYSREDWQYKLNKNNVFVENINGYKPPIEIQSENENELKRILSKLNISETLREPIAEIMRKIKK